MTTTTRRLLPSGLLLALCLASAGCAPRNPAPDPKPAWDWRESPLSDRLLLAQLPVRLGPRHSTLLRAPAAGTLTVSPDLDPDQPLPDGFEWGRIDPPDAAAENEAVERLTAEIERREQTYVRLELPALLLQLERDLRAAEDAVAAAAFAEEHPGLFSGEQPALDPALRPPLGPGPLRDAAAALRERRDRVAARDPALDPADLRALRDEHERRLRARDERRRRLVLSAPFAGRLALIGAGDGREVAAGEPLALLTDATGLRVGLRASHPALLAVPASTLELEITLPRGGVLTAAFAEAGLDAAGESMLWFDASAEPGLVGAGGLDLPARVHTRLPAPARLVPKLLVARLDEHDALAAGWRDAVPRLLPGATLVAEGRSELAVTPAAP